MDKHSNYNSEDREPAIQEMENLLNQLNKHVKYLGNVNKQLKKIDADLKKMHRYYDKEWLIDYHNFKSEKRYMVLLQDPIFNTLQDIHEKKIKLLKTIVSKIN